MRSLLRCVPRELDVLGEELVRPRDAIALLLVRDPVDRVELVLRQRGARASKMARQRLERDAQRAPNRGGLHVHSL